MAEGDITPRQKNADPRRGNALLGQHLELAIANIQ